VTVKHTFSVELEESKRAFIMAAHGVHDDMHIFGDVNIFHAPSEDHYCYTCQRSHALPHGVDLLASGPSCKNLSKQFSNRAAYSGGFLVYRCTVRTVLYAVLYCSVVQYCMQYFLQGSFFLQYITVQYCIVL
jgi:hypothetical protein